MLNEFWPDAALKDFRIRILTVERSPLRCAPLLEHKRSNSENNAPRVTSLVVGHLENIQGIHTRSIAFMISKLIRVLWTATKSRLSHTHFRRKNARLITGAMHREYTVSFDKEIARAFGSARAHIFHISPERYRPRSLLALIRDVRSDELVPSVGVAYDSRWDHNP